MNRSKIESIVVDFPNNRFIFLHRGLVGQWFATITEPKFDHGQTKIIHRIARPDEIGLGLQMLENRGIKRELLI